MAERIEIYRFSNRFKAKYKSLAREIQEAFDEKLFLFFEDPTHPCDGGKDP